jgi:hypothetical protein
MKSSIPETDNSSDYEIDDGDAEKDAEAEEDEEEDDAEAEEEELRRGRRHRCTIDWKPSAAQALAALQISHDELADRGYKRMGNICTALVYLEQSIAKGKMLSERRRVKQEERRSNDVNALKKIYNHSDDTRRRPGDARRRPDDDISTPHNPRVAQLRTEHAAAAPNAPKKRKAAESIFEDAIDDGDEVELPRRKKKRTVPLTEVSKVAPAPVPAAAPDNDTAALIDVFLSLSKDKNASETLRRALASVKK